MEKLLKPYDKEFMKMAMLKHEETFKEQVYELHRLYRIQKILMKNLESVRPNGRSQELSSTNGICFKQASQNLNSQHKPSMVKLDLEQPADEYIAESNGNEGMFDEGEIELTLGLGPTNYKRKKKPETARTTSHDSGPSFSSSSTGSSHINRTNNSRAREVLAGCELGLVHVPDSIKNEEQLRQQARLDQQPPWLFQVLSLSMT